MALDLGELYGTIGLDDMPFQGGIGRCVDAISGFGPHGAALAATAGLAIAGALGLSVFQGMNVEAANDKLSAQLGLSEAESARIGKAAGDLYAQNYGDSLDEVNDAFASVISSIDGMREASAADIQEAAKHALNFTEVLGVDVERSAQLAGQMISQGLAKDATEAFDLMTAGLQNVDVALRGDVLDAIDEYGGYFTQLGLDGQQAMGLLVAASDQGTYGIDKTGDALKEFSLRASDLADTGAQEALADIGLSGQQMANDLLAGGESGGAAMGKIVDGLLGIEDPGQQAQAAIALFGTPLEDLGKDNIPSFLQALDDGGAGMQDFAGAADEMDRVLNDNAIASIGALKRQAELAFGRLGNWALPIVNDLTAAVADNFDPALAILGFTFGVLLGAVTAAMDYIAANQTTFSIIGGIILTLLVPALVAWGTQALIAAGKNVAAWITSAAAAGTGAALHVASLTLTGGRWIWAGAQSLIGAARMAAAWLIALGPIGWAIAALAAVVVVVVKNWDRVKAMTKAAWDWVVNQVKKVPGLLVGFFLNFTLPGLIIKHWDSIKGAVSRGASAVVNYVRDIPTKIKNAFSTAKTFLLEVGKDIMRGLRDGIEVGFAWVRGKLEGVGRIIPGWLKNVLGISSPSRVMRDEVGFWIPAGVADGITAGTPLVQAAMDDMAASLLTPKVDMTASGINPFGAPGLGGTSSGAGAQVVQHIHPTPGMDEKQVGDYAGARLEFALGNG